MKSILGFDYLLTPRVLVLFYWIAMLLIFAGGVYTMFSDHLITGFMQPGRMPRDVRTDYGCVQEQRIFAPYR